MASIGVSVIRGLFGIGEHVAPAVAGRAAFELFCRTPSRRRLTDGERRAIAGAEEFMRDARHHRLKMGSGCVAVHEFRPAGGERWRGTVLVVHGWRSRTEYMRSLIEGYRAGGYRVMSLDLPGHGQSLGRRLTMVAAVEAVSQAAQWFGPFAAIVGHSFGGAVAANAVVGSVQGIAPVAAERLVMIAAPNSLPDVFDKFGAMLNLGPRTRRTVGRAVERIAGQPLERYVGSRQLAERPVPTLVIHAPDDREVSADSARMLATAGPHMSLHWAEGLGHRRILADPGVVAAAVGFVAVEEPGVLAH